MSARNAPRQAATRAPTLRLADIQGQARTIGFLRRAFERRRLAHAYLFTGPAGIGKLATARALALGLHCEVAPFEACGTCAACRTIAAGTHADVRLVAGPLAERRDISIDQVRELQRELGFRSLSTHPKVGIINDADLLTVQAQNALLKTLEEPGGDSVLVLVAANAASLAPTILSRCQRIVFDPLPPDAVARVLERHGRTAAEAAAVAAYSEGSPGRALALDADFFTAERPALLRRVAGLRGVPVTTIADLAQDLGDSDDLTTTLTVVASWYRDALHRALLGPAASLRNPDLTDVVPAAAVSVNLRNLETTYGTMVALRQNANRSLALTTLLLRLAE